MQQKNKQQYGKKSQKKAKLEPVGKAKYRNIKTNYELLDNDDTAASKSKKKKLIIEDEEEY